MDNRIGDWSETYTGVKFYPLDPRLEEINIEDIARSLSMQCRYLGHTRIFYSVAEHCVHIANSLSPGRRLALAGLLHDASEAYLGDIPRPLKPFLSGYQQIEDRLMTAIAQKFDFVYPLPQAVKEADCQILINERTHVLNDSGHHWESTEGLEPLPDTVIYGWSPYQAYIEFMYAFDGLV